MCGERDVAATAKLDSVPGTAWEPINRPRRNREGGRPVLAWEHVSTASRGSQSGSGISFQTLAIASLSSLAAALLVHKVWGGGAIVGAAITPVIVGIVGEALRRPVDKLSAPREGGRRLPADRAHDVPPASRQRGDDPFGLWEQERRRSSRGRTWLVLGLVRPQEDDHLRRRPHDDDGADRDPDDHHAHRHDADGDADRPRTGTGDD